MTANAVNVPRFNSKDTVGLSVGSEAGTVAVTVAEQGVSVYRTERQGDTVTWLIGSAAKRFVVPAVYSSATQRYFAAVHAPDQPASQQQLWSWPTELTAPILENGCNTTDLPKAVVAVLPLAAAATGDQPAITQLKTESRQHESERDQPVAGAMLVHTDASVQLDVQYSGMEEESLLTDSGPGIPVATALHHRQLALVYRDHEQSLQLTLTTVQGNATLESKGPAALQPPSSSATVSATCLHNYCFTILWSDGTLQAWQLATGPSSQLHMALQSKQQVSKLALAPSQLLNGKVRPRPKQTGAKLLDPLRGDSLASLVGVHGSLVGVLAWSAVHNGEAEGQRLQFIVRDLHYGSEPFQAELTMTNTSAPAVPTLQALIFNSNGQQQLAALVGGRVLTAPLQVQPVTLASLVASAAQRPTAAVSAPQHDSAQWLSALERAAAEPRIAVPVTPMEVEEPSTSASAWQQLVNEVNSLRQGPGSHKAAVKVVSSILQQKIPPSAELLCQAALTLAQQGHFKALAQLLQPHVLPSLGQCRGLVPVLAQEEQHELLDLLLPHGRDLPAADLLALLDSLLQSRATAGAKEARRKHRQHLRQQAQELVQSAASGSLPVAVAAAAAHAVDAFTAQETCLHAVVAMRLDSTVMLAVLQTLLPEQVLLLARHLLKWLEFHEGCPEGLAGASSAQRLVTVPSMQSMLQWLSVAVNAHLVALALLPGSSEVIVTMQQSVQQQLQSSRGLTKLLGIVQHLSQQAALPSSTADVSALYSIEALDLRIYDT